MEYLEYNNGRSTGVGGYTTNRLVLNGGVIVHEATEEFNTSRTGNHWSERVTAPKGADECVICFNRNRSGREMEATVVSEPIPEWANAEFLREIARRFEERV